MGKRRGEVGAISLISRGRAWVNASCPAPLRQVGRGTSLHWTAGAGLCRGSGRELPMRKWKLSMPMWTGPSPSQKLRLLLGT